MTDDQIQALLTVRALVGVNGVDYTLVDRADGQGAVVDVWKPALGAVPTPADIAALTAPQIAAAQTATRVGRFTATSRQKDQLATCALVVRARGIAAWNALTVPQKVAATLAEADVWTSIRDFIENNT